MKKHTGLRKIKNGTIKFFGGVYKPKDEYNGELDGQIWYFMAYEPLKDTKTLAMWGSKRLYDITKFEREPQSTFSLLDNEKNIMSNGTIKWYIWKEEQP